MTRPLLSLRSSSRQAAACARISDFGYHLNGTLTSSASYPDARSCPTSSRTWYSAPPRTNGTWASQTRIVRKTARMLSRGVTERDYVAVLHRIVLPLQSELAMVAARRQ